VTDAHGDVVKSLSDVALGNEVHVLVSDGSFASQVTEMKGTPR
jgi:exonuclease VII large subunit